MPQGSVLGPLLFLLYTSGLSPILENLLIDYADYYYYYYTTLIAVVPFLGATVAVASP